jgi:hypothetical protein
LSECSTGRKCSISLPNEDRAGDDRRGDCMRLELPECVLGKEWAGEGRPFISETEGMCDCPFDTDSGRENSAMETDPAVENKSAKAETANVGWTSKKQTPRVGRNASIQYIPSVCDSNR